MTSSKLRICKGGMAHWMEMGWQCETFGRIFIVKSRNDDVLEDWCHHEGMKEGLRLGGNKESIQSKGCPLRWDMPLTVVVRQICSKDLLRPHERISISAFGVFFFSIGNSIANFILLPLTDLSVCASSSMLVCFFFNLFSHECFSACHHASSPSFFQISCDLFRIEEALLHLKHCVMHLILILFFEPTWIFASFQHNKQP